MSKEAQREVEVVRVSLLYERNRLGILRLLREKNDTPELLALKMEIPNRRIHRHIAVLKQFGLIEKLPQGQSLLDPKRQSGYVVYRITTLGMNVLAQSEKKPEVM